MKTPPRALNLVHPAVAPAGLGPVSVALALQGDELTVRFDVTAASSHSNPALARDAAQWGLWDWDVVELFIQPRANDPTYYEFQVSPLDQFFELEIFEPRKRFNKEYSSGFGHKASSRPGGWTAEMRISLAKLGWNGEATTLRGNAFAIIGGGAPSPRSYWSLFLSQQQKPDFHLPEKFLPLF
jgi:hypothetical protein